MKSIKVSEYFKLVHPSYVYLKIIPHKSIRNYNSSNIAKAISNTYRALNRRIHKEQKKLFFETNFKISYVIDIEGNNASFYFLVPQPFKNIIIEKIKEIWTKATIEEVEPIKSFSKDSIKYELSYKKEDALSLQVDKKSNEPLNSILSVIDIMKEEDRITIVYNFQPCSQFGWIERYTDTIERIKEGKIVDKEKGSMSYILKNGALTLVNLLNSILGVINDFAGGEPLETKDSLYNSISRLLEEKKELSPATKRKKEQQIINTQIAVISSSLDTTRRENNALGVCQAFRVLDEDNELIYKKVDSNTNLEDYSINTKVSTFSTDECQNFIQVPGRVLLTQYGLNHIKTEESTVPEKLRKGFFSLGTNTCKGTKTDAYLDQEYNVANLPLTLIGGQGSGKSTFIKNKVRDCSNNGEGVLVLDIIKNCELTEDIKAIVDKDKLVVIDLSKESDIQGLGYNEIVIDNTMTPYDRLSLASIQSQQIMSLVDSISVGDPLSSRMRRYLNAAANITFVQGYSSVKDVINCLTNYKIREEYIRNLSKELKGLLEDEVLTLQELDEWSKATKDNISEVVGTKDSKIEHILDRVAMLREDFKLKYMYNKDTKDNINLVELMDQGKVVLIQMRESDFPTKMIKNILVTYWISKVWLASQIRGSKVAQPLRSNIIIDEVFQAPTSLSTLNYILPQSRKFGTKFIFSTQYMKQLDSIFESLEASGGSFMLLTGSNEDDFNHFKSKLDNYEYEDLRDMDRYSSLNIIKYSEGYSSFITKLPPK